MIAAIGRASAPRRSRRCSWAYAITVSEGNCLDCITGIRMGAVGFLGKRTFRSIAIFRYFDLLLSKGHHHFKNDLNYLSFEKTFW